MPQFLQASYDNSNSLGKAIESLGANLFPSPANQLSAAQASQTRLKMELGAAANGLTTRALAGDRDAIDQLAANLVQTGVATGNGVEDARKALLYGGVQRLNNSDARFDNDASQTMLATGSPVGQTPLETRRARDAEMARLQETDAAQLRLEREKSRLAIEKMHEEEGMANRRDDRKIIWGRKADGTEGYTTEEEQRQALSGLTGPLRDGRAPGDLVTPGYTRAPTPDKIEESTTSKYISNQELRTKLQITKDEIAEKMRSTDANIRAEGERQMNTIRSAEGLAGKERDLKLDLAIRDIDERKRAQVAQITADQTKVETTTGSAEKIAAANRLNEYKMQERELLEKRYSTDATIRAEADRQLKDLRSKFELQEKEIASRERMQTQQIGSTEKIAGQQIDAASRLEGQKGEIATGLARTQGEIADALDRKRAADALKLQGARLTSEETRAIAELANRREIENAKLAEARRSGDATIRAAAEQQAAQIAATRLNEESKLSSAERQQLRALEHASQQQAQQISATSDLEGLRIAGASALKDKEISGASALADKTIAGTSALATQNAEAADALATKKIEADVAARRLDRQIERDSKLETPIRVTDAKLNNAVVEVPFGQYLDSVKNNENRYAQAESLSDFSKRAAEQYKVDRAMVDVVDNTTNEQVTISNYELNRPENARKYRGQISKENAIGSAMYNAMRADGKTPGAVMDALGSEAEKQGRVDDVKEVRDTIVAAAQKANIGQNMKSQLKALDELNEGGQLSTGILTEKFLPVIKTFGQLGIFDPNWTGKLEAFEGATNNIVVAAADNKLGGNFSNTDLDFLRKTKPGIGLSKEGNRLTIEVMRRAADRNIEAHMEMERLRQQNRNISPGELALKMHDWVNKQPSAFAGLSAQNPPRARSSLTGSSTPPLDRRNIVDHTQPQAR